jgi:hypothetical protein
VLVLGGSFLREVNDGQGGSTVCAGADGDDLCLTLPSQKVRRNLQKLVFCLILIESPMRQAVAC